ncbi:MAG: hypothetical protein DWQ31_16560 [Planctomycetota bacterium]|nr:MAG: hypothetical protein DWQ31_16560 [Planctomycetota bacterium]
MHSDLRSKTLTTANTDETAATGTVAEIFTAAREEFLYKLIIKSLGDNAATVLRVWLNNGHPRTTPDNNSFVADLTLTSATASQTAAQAIYSIDLGLWIPEKTKLLCAIGTAGTDGWQVTAVVGDDYAERYLV